MPSPTRPVQRAIARPIKPWRNRSVGGGSRKSKSLPNQRRDPNARPKPPLIFLRSSPVAHFAFRKLIVPRVVQ